MAGLEKVLLLAAGLGIAAAAIASETITYTYDARGPPPANRHVPTFPAWHIGVVRSCPRPAAMNQRGNEPPFMVKSPYGIDEELGFLN